MNPEQDRGGPKDRADLRVAVASSESTIWGQSLALAGVVLFAFYLSMPSACSNDGSAWSEAVEPGAVSKSNQQVAEAARDDLAQRLQRELTAAISEGGPTHGIQVCSSRAAAIAAEVGQQQGLRIGRTSVRLRSPANQPPIWAVAAVEANVPEAKFFRHDAGHLGALFPIRIAPKCLLCHGPADGLATEVRSALSSAYPADAATGFELGDLRGWFWVEVP